MIKRKKTILSLLFASFFIGIAVISFFKAEKQTNLIKATGNKPGVTIDAGTDKSYDVKADNIGKVEVVLDPSFVQAPGYVYNFEKKEISAYAEQYYVQNNTYSQTYYLGTYPISDEHSVVLVYGYGKTSLFAGTTAILVDRNTNKIINDAQGNPRMIRSSDTYINSGESSHTAGPGMLLSYDDGTFGFIVGNFSKSVMYRIVFDKDFNIIKKNELIDTVTPMLNYVTMYGGYEVDGGKIVIGTDNINGSPHKAILYEMNKNSNVIENVIEKEVPPVENIFPGWNRAAEIVTLVGGIDAKKNVIETEDGGMIAPIMFGKQGTDTAFMITKWNKNNELEYYTPPMRDDYGGINTDIVHAISDTDYYYYWNNKKYDTDRTVTKDSKLMRIDLKNPGTIDTKKELHPEVVKTFPQETSLQISKENKTNTYFFYGYLGNPNTDSETDKEFQKFGVTTSGMVVGQMDMDFNVINAQSIPSNGKTKFKEFNFDTNNPEIVKVSGDTAALDFPDAEFSTKYANKNWNANRQLAFWGEMKVIENYAPGIKAETITIDKDSFTSEEEYEKALLSGVKVTDTYDLDPNGGNKSQDWLNNRINKNPNDETLPIDWKALGLDKDVRGPQEPKYFIVDSTYQQSVTSRLINVVDQNTDYDEDYALGADNFDISVDSVKTLTEQQVKTQSNTKVWQLSDGAVMDDGTAQKSIVSVDTQQLKVINEVQDAYNNRLNNSEYPGFEDYSDLIKPYPLTLTYSYTNSKGITQKLERVITVFITNETTKVSKEQNEVMYAFNFRYPLRKAASLDDTTILAMSNAETWAYNNIWGTGTSEKSGFQTNRDAPYNAQDEYRTGVNNARRPDYYNLILTQNSLINDQLTVELYAETAKLNVRQIVLDPNDELVVVSDGYLKLKNIENTKLLIQPLGTELGVSDISIPDEKKEAQEVYIRSDSGTNISKVAYESVKLPIHYGYYFYQAELIIPEYYQYVGFELTDSPNQTGEVKDNSIPQINYIGETEEYWLTMYIKPSLNGNENPGVYHWDYGQEDKYTIVE